MTGTPSLVRILLRRKRSNKEQRHPIVPSCTCQSEQDHQSIAKALRKIYLLQNAEERFSSLPQAPKQHLTRATSGRKGLYELPVWGTSIMVGRTRYQNMRHMVSAVSKQRVRDADVHLLPFLLIQFRIWTYRMELPKT